MRERSPGRWQLNVYLGRDPVTGKKKYRSTTVEGGKRVAQRELARLIAEVDKGAPSTSAPFSDLVDEWWRLDSPRLSPSTARNYRVVLDSKILQKLGSRKLSSISVRDLDVWYAELSHTLAPNSVRNVHAITRRILNRGVAWGWIDRNPALHATLPEQRDIEVSPPSPRQVKALLEAAKENPTFYVAVRLAASTGARRSQLCGVRWRDIGEDGVLTMTAGIVEGLDGLVEKDTKEGNRITAPLDEGTLAVLEEYRRERSALLVAAGGPELPDDAFVLSRSIDGSTPPRPGWITTAWTRLRNRVGFPNVRFHDLRHYVGTQLMAEYDPVTVARRLGHRSPTTTLRFYAHGVKEQDRNAATTMGRLLDE